MDGVIEATIEVSVAFEPVRRKLLDDLAQVVGDGGPQSDARGEVRTALVVDVNAAPGIQEEVLVEVLVRTGPVQAGPSRLSLPLSWQAVDWPRLFPTFEGSLEVTRRDRGSVVRLKGAYTVPTGPLGRFGDGVAGRRLARQAGSSFLEHVARRIDGEEHQSDLMVWHAAPRPIALEQLNDSARESRRS